MARTGVIKWVVGVSLISALILGVNFFWKRPQAVKPVVDEQALRDRATLLNPQASDSDIMGALVRLAQKGDALSHDEALKRVKSPAQLVRVGVASALGYFTDEAALDIVKELVEDSDPTVRIAALHALGNRPGGGREEAIREQLGKKLDEKERVITNAALLRIASAVQNRQVAIGGLLRVARSSRDAALAYDAFMRLLSLAPADKMVVEALRKLVEGDVHNPLFVPAFSHLASLRDPVLRGRLEGLLNSSEPSVRIAAVDAIRYLCPPNRIQIVDRLLKQETDAGVLKRVAVLAAALRAPTGSGSVCGDSGT